MKINKRGVGVIGANMNGSWGALAHLPALLALPEFQAAAVCTTRQDSADETAKHFGIPHAFTDPYELAIHPDVDLVTIAVKVPEHKKLVQTALQVGKSVLCEFPLGRSSAEAADLLHASEEKGVRHFAGLQSRANPAVRYLKDLIAEGYIGEIRAVHCSYALPLFPSRSKQIPQSRVYLLDKTNGANHLTIAAGHLLDGLTYLLGPFSEVSAVLETQAERIPTIETGEVVQATSPDHVVIIGKLAGGAIMNTHIRNTHIGHFSIEINGTEGDLILQSNENFMFQIDSFTLKGAQPGNKAFGDLPIPPQYILQPSGLPAGPAFNLAGLYREIYSDLENNSRLAPDFHTALAAHTLIDAVQRAADTGTRQSTEPMN
ncbi:Gfo/Idh/MocA family protein [Paenibacillus sabinae]|uniref:Gfo/Idh/MocA family oxidoreductase n=1 Tax=Paenibacillus sabinae T27 TaxID=1268072 RepID=X4Z6B2_9BACL|nr:Gfo/Idh/MocA family oxidoreductase [Paenibacillus sabinae]AHV95301.1 Gfo/Idh/MocA family oxidoreductase [Paenibacillus sabinae T27]